MELNDPWRCDACQGLIYNLDRDGRPTVGAPGSQWGNIKYQRVCSACKAMLTPIENSDYWRSIQREWELLQEKRRKDNDGLSGKTDYFTGA